MRASEIINEDAAAQGDADALFEMANLYPQTTGLPMTVWVSPRGRARHDARIKVNVAHGSKMDIDNTAVVGIRPHPHIVAGDLPAQDQEAVFAWVSLNSQPLIDYWNGSIDTVELGQRLRKV